MPNQSVTTKNLGLVQALSAGVNPPINEKLIWFDSNAGLHKVFLNGSWITFAQLLANSNPAPTGNLIFSQVDVVGQTLNANVVALLFSESFTIEEIGESVEFEFDMEIFGIKYNTKSLNLVLEDAQNNSITIFNFPNKPNLGIGNLNSSDYIFLKIRGNVTKKASNEFITSSQISFVLDNSSSTARQTSFENLDVFSSNPAVLNMDSEVSLKLQFDNGSNDTVQYYIYKAVLKSNKF